MSKLMNINKAKFINDNIDIFRKNKISQYSKFLDKNPLFVTYYHINHARSVVDVGTGGIERETGRRSPIRFNKILDFPMYNFPEFKPDLIYDETGADVELELSDIVVLPNTLKPNPGDYVLIEFPGIRRFLFRVNQIAYNTIQSNDYYTVSMDLKFIDKTIDEEDIEYQVVEEYQTIFENIGTQDKCFIRNKDIEALNSLSDLHETISTLYKNTYYNHHTNTFEYVTSDIDCESWNLVRVYDPYLEHFINKSHIYYEPNSEHSLVLTHQDLLNVSEFNYTFSKSLYNAVLERSILQLGIFEYSYIAPIQKHDSVYIIDDDYTAYGVHLHISNIDIREYMKDDSGDGEPVWYDIFPLERWIPTWTANKGNEYFEIRFLEAIKNGTLRTNDIYEQIIYNYLYHIGNPISRQKLYDECDKRDKRGFYFIPMIIYIIDKIYDEYMHQEVDQFEV